MEAVLARGRAAEVVEGVQREQERGEVRGQPRVVDGAGRERLALDPAAHRPRVRVPVARLPAQQHLRHGSGSRGASSGSQVASLSTAAAYPSAVGSRTVRSSPSR